MLAKFCRKWLKMSLLFLFVIAFLSKCGFGGYFPYNYCDPNLKLCADPWSHTMCRYLVSGPPQNSASVIHDPLTPEEKVHVLLLHNKLRNRVALGEEKTHMGPLPSASNMLQMIWDDELEAIAERWASRCLNVTSRNIHDDCRNTKRFRVTQNIGTILTRNITSDKRVIQIFYRWYIQSKTFNPQIINSYVEAENKTYDDFVNLIWADTFALGCANVKFRKNLTESKNGGRVATRTFVRIVCNYGPGGMIPGKPVYKTGVPCSQCPTGWVCSNEFRGLCILKENLKFNSMRTNKRRFGAGLRKISNKPLGENATFVLRYSTPKAINSLEDLGAFHGLTFNTFDKKTHHFIFKVQEGIYFNGLCICPGPPNDKKRRSPREGDNLKNLGVLRLSRTVNKRMSRKISDATVKNGLKNGDFCYCSTITANGDRGNKPSILYLIIIFIVNCLHFAYNEYYFT